MASLLIIEDSESQRSEIRSAIEASALFGRVLEASDGLRGLKLLISDVVDVVLCDLEMPGLDGEKLLHLKRSRPDLANVPFIFLTGTGDVERRARLFQDGASDAIAKPFHPAELVARLAHHLSVKQVRDELEVKNATLARLSTVDALTGLRTRRYVNELLAIEFLRARRYTTPLAVVMADLDHFKQVNDRYGHPAGDAVLRGVAETLLGCLRSTDTAGRYGGEEILVVLGHNDAGGASVFGERWRAAVEQAKFRTPSGQQIQVTLSLGIADYLGRADCRNDFEAPEELVAAADRALYVAKEKGRNRLEIDSGAEDA